MSSTPQPLEWVRIDRYHEAATPYRVALYCVGAGELFIAWRGRGSLGVAKTAAAAKRRCTLDQLKRSLASGD